MPNVLVKRLSHISPELAECPSLTLVHIGATIVADCARNDNSPRVCLASTVECSRVKYGYPQCRTCSPRAGPEFPAGDPRVSRSSPELTPCFIRLNTLGANGKLGANSYARSATYPSSPQICRVHPERAPCCGFYIDSALHRWRAVKRLSHNYSLNPDLVDALQFNSGQLGVNPGGHVGRSRDSSGGTLLALDNFWRHPVLHTWDSLWSHSPNSGTLSTKNYPEY